ncbi:MAG: hypothetical protein U0237_03790 [Thermoleophilia bacterium]
MCAHELAVRILDEAGYGRTRGVAQQAARIARSARLERDRRARLLCAAWLHRLGAPRDTARRLRAAGHEDLARIVAHTGFAAMAANIRGEAPLEAEFPVPQGADEGLLMLLDVAGVTTDQDGAAASPARCLRQLVERVGPADPEVRAMVALVTRLGEDPGARALVEFLAPAAPAR